VFLASPHRETPENAIKPQNRNKTDIEIFVDFCRKKFLTWTFGKYIFYGVFELPLPRNAKKLGGGGGKMYLGFVGFSEFNQISNIRQGPSFFFEGPLSSCSHCS
jgi:hypothetical protein